MWQVFLLLLVCWVFVCQIPVRIIMYHTSWHISKMTLPHGLSLILQVIITCIGWIEWTNITQVLEWEEPRPYILWSHQLTITKVDAITYLESKIVIDWQCTNVIDNIIGHILRGELHITLVCKLWGQYRWCRQWLVKMFDCFLVALTIEVLA